jgi:hypothetical protein
MVDECFGGAPTRRDAVQSMILRARGAELLFIGRLRSHRRERAHALLSQLADSESGMRYLRAALDQVRSSAEVARLGDEDVLDEVAIQIAQGRLTLIPLRPEEAIVPPIQGSEAQSPPPEAIEPEPETPAEVKPAEAEDEMLAAVDAAAQAATLIKAAEEGVPFCEECAKPRARAA